MSTRLGRLGAVRRLLGSAPPPPPDVVVAAGERVLAWAVVVPEAEPAPPGSTTHAAATRSALYLPAAGDPAGAHRIPWEQVEAADWDAETETFRVSEVGEWGQQRPEHRLRLADPTRLLQLVRERVTASVVHLRHVPIEGRRGARVIARRAPNTHEPLHWIVEYDDGIDPGDLRVRLAVAEELALARGEVGDDDGVARP
ncbi:hypothetical protein [Nocardioides sp.]|uniref:hypothetical protein n=1 Tax=Nocardioides sp. TaxID=35761 RepID=UPI0035115EA9